MLIYHLVSTILIVLAIAALALEVHLYRRALFEAQKQEVLDMVYGFLEDARPKAPVMLSRTKRNRSFKSLFVGIPVLLFIGSAVSFSGGPFVVDTDGDGILDNADPNPLDIRDADFDGDGLNGFEEEKLGTDSRKADTDGDRIMDNADPNPLDIRDADFDGDGLNGFEEEKLGTDSRKADTDGDWMDDKAEADGGSNPLKADTDGDGLVDGDEVKGGTSPLKADTDGDGQNDRDDPCPIDKDDCCTAEDKDGDGFQETTPICPDYDDYPDDNDNDGVNDRWDKCPGTPSDINVDAAGCAEKEFTSPTGIDFVLIPAGEFDMGSPSSEKNRRSGEGPVHRVKISKPFYMGKYEVTQKQWREVMGNNPSRFSGCDECPVEEVSWNDVQEFIRKLNQKEGTDKYRLPTEAEWEYAARAGTKTAYSFGDDESKLGKYAWYYDNSGRKTHSVGQKKPNPWGLYDMHGNVWEWVQDWTGKYPSGTVTDPQGPSSGSRRVRRGVGWNDDARDCRSAIRYYSASPDYRNFDLGFRLAFQV